ncbi:hypothetical protein PAP_03065 [Palaeococcus pacificus DY20341]|uniref:ASCH domain-containing protein n=1 Tax=Palaeococcus pacificus DY20341 TaxID=1343739 RepID=A0A075LWV5_9EURY|nr:ASCH domain-containing protein [Palaeococcus pacificus]AIF69033.1 hypothetical protein PAP_03065 [Palaeococcus pacificus DY20341]
MYHIIALHQVYGELIFRGLKSHEIRRSNKFGEGDIVFLYIARGNPHVLRETLQKLGLSQEQLLTQRGTIAGGFEVGEVIKADFETLWQITKDTSGLSFVYGEEKGKAWLKEYVGDFGYAFTIEKPFIFKEPMSREEMKERYGVHVEGIIHLSSRTRKPWVKELLEDLTIREILSL